MKFPVYIYVMHLRGYDYILTIDKNRRFAKIKQIPLMRYLSMIERLKFHLPDKSFKRFLTIAECLAC
jgi:hypothetical protein